MRGFEPEDLLNEKDCNLSRYELASFFYLDSLIKKVGSKGLSV